MRQKVPGGGGTRPDAFIRRVSKNDKEGAKKGRGGMGAGGGGVHPRRLD